MCMLPIGNGSNLCDGSVFSVRYCTTRAYERREAVHKLLVLHMYNSFSVV